MNSLKHVNREIERFNFKEEPINCILHINVNTLDNQKKVEIMKRLQLELLHIVYNDVKLCFYNVIENDCVFFNRQNYPNQFKAQILCNFFAIFSKLEDVKIDYLLSKPIIKT